MSRGFMSGILEQEKMSISLTLLSVCMIFILCIVFTYYGASTTKSVMTPETMAVLAQAAKFA